MPLLTAQPARWRPVVMGLVLALACAGPAVAGRDRDPAKISARAREEAKAKDNASVDVLVRFTRTPGHVEHSLLRTLGGQVRREHRSRWMAVRLPGRLVEKLAGDPGVEFVATNATVSASKDASRATVWDPSPEMPETAFKGAGVTIAMIDSGVAAHPAIQTLVGSVDFVAGVDPAFEPQSSVDPNGHGTHVAGIMVGGGAEFAGIAPQASLISLRVLGADGSGSSSDMLGALEWVLAHKDQHGIRVLNLSLGHPVYERAEVDPLVQAVDALWDAGVVVVCAAGNDGRNGHSTITSPCNSRKVVTVGALNDKGTLDTADDTITTYSSRGPTRFDLVAKPDLVAPGNRVVSARAAGSHLDLLFPENLVPGNPDLPLVLDHIKMSGTSMAAPFVSGAVALMLEQQPLLNPGTVKARLMLSARKAAAGDPFATGAGVLDVVAALRAPGTVADAPSPRAFADGDSGEMRFENTGTLWADPSFSLVALWSNAVLWSEATQADDAVLSSYAVLWSDTSANAVLWSEATLWTECTLWSESVVWADEDP